MECARFKTSVFLEIGEKTSPDWICMVDTQVTDIPFGLSLSRKL